HPRFVDGAWLICNSAKQELLQLDGLSGEVRRKLELRGWTRGVCVSDDLIFVGESAMRTNSLPSSSATIAIISRKDFSLLHRIEVPCREIYDLILIPNSMLAGLRRGFRTNP